MTRTLIALCIILVAVAGTTFADEGPGALPQSATAPDEPAVRERYTRLMNSIDRGQNCVVSKAAGEREMNEALREFVKMTEYVSLERETPVQVTLPEGYYNPQGRAVAFDKFEIAVNSNDLSKPYISMTMTPEGLMVESKVLAEFKSGTTLCVRYFSAVVPFKSRWPKPKSGAADASAGAPRP